MNDVALNREDALFLTTCWSRILSAQLDPERLREVGLLLCERYYRPVEVYLRMWLRNYGCAQEDVEDLTHEFLAKKLLEDHMFVRACRTKGKFRTFLLGSLRNFMLDWLRANLPPRDEKAHAHKAHVLVLDEELEAVLPDLDKGAQSEMIRAWAAQILDGAIDATRKGCERAGQMAHWHVFESRVLHPLFTNEPEPTSQELCAELGLENPAQVDNMNGTVKRRFKANLWARVRQEVESDDEVEAEIDDLIRILSN